MLPDFGPDNWTSELRSEIPGFNTYPPGSFGDFTYDDSKGALTELIYGAERKKAWNGLWPTYHLEVKASLSGRAREPFHVSARQLEIVSFAMSY